jgi:hypothetical protein
MDLKKTVVIIRIITFTAILLAFNSITAFALPKQAGYVLLYDRLYDYDSNVSEVLRQYIELRSAGADVLLLQADKLDAGKIEKNAIIIIFASSFESTDKHDKVLNTLKGFQVMPYNGHLFSTGERAKNPGLFLAINEVYPFSDFTKLMDLAETLNDKGIEFMVSVMPVYDNYELEAFQKYVDVLKYVEEKGGKLFIHFPVVNDAGTYNLDPSGLFEKAVKELRKRGLDILGITLPQNKMLNDLAVYDGLDLPFILATETEGRINSGLDLFEASQVLNDYIIIKGTHINHFDYFGYRGKIDLAGERAAFMAIQDKTDELFNLLNVFKTERIPIKDFRAGDYSKILRDSGYMKNRKIFGLQEKSQREKFLEAEMKKIKGENLKQENNTEGYDISRFSRIVVRMAMMLLGAFFIMVLIGRRFNYRKFLKDQLHGE